MQGWGMNLVTTVIGFGMSATFFVFVCARLICARARSSESRAAAATAAAAPFDFDLELHADAEQPERTFHGLEPVAIAAFPIIAYNKEAFSSRGDLQCSICLADYQEKETVRIMPACGHDFHVSCIDVWLQKQTTCPICRLSLHESLEAKDVQSLHGGFPHIVVTSDASVNQSRIQLQPRNDQLAGSRNHPEFNGVIHVSVEA